MHTAALRPGNYTHPKSIEARQSLPFRAVLRPPAQRWPTSNGERFLIGHCSSDKDLIDGSVIWLKHLERVALSDLHKSAVGAPAGCRQARPLYADECLTVLLQVGRRRPDLGGGKNMEINQESYPKFLKYELARTLPFKLCFQVMKINTDTTVLIFHSWV